MNDITDPVECYDIMWKAKEYLLDYALVKEGSAMEDTNPYGDHSPGQGFKMPDFDPYDGVALVDAARRGQPIILAGVKYVPAEPITRSEQLDNSRDGLISEAQQHISGDRQKTYGDARSNFTRTGKLWEPVLGYPVTPEQVALCMALVKIDRLRTSKSHRDNWVDLIGYAALGGEIALNPEGAA